MDPTEYIDAIYHRHIARNVDWWYIINYFDGLTEHELHNLKLIRICEIRKADPSC